MKEMPEGISNHPTPEAQSPTPEFVIDDYKL
jgi:hypothetical protein